MKKLSLITLFACPTFLFAQVQLSGNNHRLSNGEVLVRTGTSFTLNAGSEGNNVDWNFTNLGGTETLQITESSTNFAYLPANHKVTVGNMIYYYQSSNQRFAMIRRETASDTVTYNLPQVICNFPLNFEQTFNGTFFGIASSFIAPVVLRNGTYEGEYDGFGTLHLPDKSYEGVIRVKTTSEITETPEIVGGARETDYIWYHPDIKEPLLRITIREQEIFGFFVPVSRTFTWLVAPEEDEDPIDPVFVKELNKAVDIQIFPNPASNFIQVQLKETSDFEIKMFKLTGSEVFSKKHTHQKQVHLEVNHLPRGIYLLHINTNDFNEVRKIVLE